MKATVTLLIVAIASCLQIGWCQHNCPIATAADGSTYDLSYISDRIHQASQVAGGQVYTYNISICAPAPKACAGSCSYPNTSAVCQFWGDISMPNVKCFGSYDTVQVEGLNDGFGVQIKYSGGDVCGYCNPSTSRTSVITLKCIFDESDPSKIEWASVGGGEAQTPPFIYFNGTFNCITGDRPKNRTTTQFFSYASDSGTCNKKDAYMVTVNRTVQCTPGCSLVSDSYVYTECDRILELPSGTWVEQINSPNATCDTADSAVYMRDQCAGFFEFSRVTCDENAIYWYKCNSPYCNSCSLLSMTPTETCVNGTKYICATSFNSCKDGLKNYDETDVDCGGPTCMTRCGLNQTCANDSDCDVRGCVEGYCGGPPEAYPLESPTVPPTTTIVPQSPMTPVKAPLALELASSGDTFVMLTGITALISFATICLQ